MEKNRENMMKLEIGENKEWGGGPAKYVTTDTHGRSDLFFPAVAELLKEGDRLYHLGDANDRGPGGYQIIKWLQSQKNVVHLRGNHEQMLLDMLYDCFEYLALQNKRIDHIEEFWELLDSGEIEARSDSKAIWQYPVNGGWATLENMKQEIKSYQEVLELYQYLYSLDTCKKVECNGRKFFLVHGCPSKTFQEHEMLWYSTDPQKTYFSDDTIAVFGHTTTDMYQKATPLEVYQSPSGHVIGLDTGAGYTPGGRLSFLRLNDGQVFYYG